MDLYRLGLVSSRTQYFLLVARAGSIRQAAKVTNVAPSSISRAIRQLEDEMGVPLFERVQQRLRLTSAGDLLYYHVRQSTGELNRALTGINDLSGLRRGTVSIAVIESAARGMLSDVLAGFWARSPEITVEAKVAGSGEAAEMVAEGDVHLALALDVAPSHGVQRIAEAGLPVGVLVAPDSPLADKPEVTGADLAGERVLLSTSGIGPERAAEQAAGCGLMDGARRMCTNSLPLMIELVRCGQGVLLHTRFGLEQEIGRGELVFVPVRRPRLPRRRLVLLSRTRADLPDAAASLASAMVRAFARLAD